MPPRTPDSRFRDWRGAPLGAGDGLLGLYLSCHACGRAVRIRHAEAVAAWGSAARVGEIARRLVCSGCGARRGCIDVIVDLSGMGAGDAPAGGYWGAAPARPEATAASLGALKKMSSSPLPSTP